MSLGHRFPNPFGNFHPMTSGPTAGYVQRTILHTLDGAKRIHGIPLWSKETLTLVSGGYNDRVGQNKYEPHL